MIKIVLLSLIMFLSGCVTTEIYVPEYLKEGCPMPTLVKEEIIKDVHKNKKILKSQVLSCDEKIKRFTGEQNGK